MLRQLLLLPLLVIPIATTLFVSREGIVKVAWLAPAERQVGAPVIEQFQMASTHTGKTYAIRVEVPADYAASTAAYPIVYVIHPKPEDVSYEKVLAPVVRTFSAPDAIEVTVSPVRGEPGRRRDAVAESGSWSDDMSRVVRQAVGARPSGGKADRFTEFLESELFPRVEGKYRIQGRGRCLVGHDLSAVFALDTALSKPELFGRYVAIAPHANWTEIGPMRIVTEKLGQGWDPDIRLYLAIGTLDDTPNVRIFTKLTDLLRTKRFTTAAIQWLEYPNRGHFDVVPMAAQDGLKFVFAK